MNGPLVWLSLILKLKSVDNAAETCNVKSTLTEKTVANAFYKMHTVITILQSFKN